MADGPIHNFTVAGCQKNPSKELIILWITGASSDISEEMIESSFFECVQIMFFLTLVLRNCFLCFLLPPLFFTKIGVCIIHGCPLYTGKYSNYL